MPGLTFLSKSLHRLKEKSGHNRSFWGYYHSRNNDREDVPLSTATGYTTFLYSEAMQGS